MNLLTQFFAEQLGERVYTQKEGDGTKSLKGRTILSTFIEVRRQSGNRDTAVLCQRMREGDLVLLPDKVYHRLAVFKGPRSPKGRASGKVSPLWQSIHWKECGDGNVQLYRVETTRLSWALSGLKRFLFQS